MNNDILALREIEWAERKNLSKLDLSGYELERLPDLLFHISTLRDLNLSGNHIREIPDQIDLLNLTTLNLSRNLISDLPSQFANLSKMRRLNRSDNKITNSEMLFSRLKLFHALQ